MTTTIRPIRPGEELQVARVLDQTFEAVPLQARRDLWRWRNEVNPARAVLDLPTFLVAELDRTIVGVHGLFPLRLQVDERIVPVSCACDFAVLPAARTVGLKLKLAAAQHGGVPAHISTSANDAASRLTVALGGREIRDARTTLIKPLRMAPLVSQRASRLAGGLAGSLLGVMGSVIGKFGDGALGGVRRLRARSGALRSISVSSLRRFTETHDEFWNEIRPTGAVHLVRDTRYLNWRYSDYPFPGIETLQAREGERVLALLVSHLHRDSEGNQVGSVLEFLSRPGFFEVALGLLGLAEARLRSAGAVVCVARTASEELKEALAASGFHRRERDLSPYTCRVEASEWNHGLSDTGNWAFSLGDGDTAFHLT